MKQSTSGTDGRVKQSPFTKRPGSSPVALLFPDLCYFGNQAKTDGWATSHMPTARPSALPSCQFTQDHLIGEPAGLQGIDLLPQPGIPIVAPDRAGRQVGRNRAEMHRRTEQVQMPPVFPTTHPQRAQPLQRFALTRIIPMDRFRNRFYPEVQRRPPPGQTAANQATADQYPPNCRANPSSRK